MTVGDLVGRLEAEGNLVGVSSAGAPGGAAAGWDPKRVVTGIEQDSREVGPANVFVAIQGYENDGVRYAPAAVAAGAAAVVVAEGAELPELPVTGRKPPVVVRVRDPRAAMAQLAAEYYGNPGRGLAACVGLTGTNGKTTTSYIVRGVLGEGLGYPKVGVVGTIAYWVGETEYPAPHTTPDAINMQRLLCGMRVQGVQALVSEVSSHALALKRVDGVDFDVGVFTNLTRDHLDFHKTFEDYRAAKGRLFAKLTDPGRHVGVVNLDDPEGPWFASQVGPGVPVLSFAIDNKDADVHPTSLELSLFETKLTVRTPQGSVDLSSGMRGRANVYNILAGVTVGLAKGVPLEQIKLGVAACKAVPGRFESVDMDQKFAVIVDYAHTPDALERLLLTAREIGAKRLICVVGCGGDRDTGKRPLMGGIASRLADHAVITSDNPRTESPSKILEDIKEGMPGGGDPAATPDNCAVPHVVEDRAQAIRMAISLAGDGDAVVIAGKGHEDYQIIGKDKFDFDDRIVAALALQELGYRNRFPSYYK